MDASLGTDARTETGTALQKSDGRRSDAAADPLALALAASMLAGPTPPSATNVLSAVADEQTVERDTNEVSALWPLAPASSERPKSARELDGERETLLVKSVYDTEREYLSVAAFDKHRAAGITKAKDALLLTPELSDRARALAAHHQAKVALLAPRPGNPARKVVDSAMDPLFALALVARQRDDEHYEDTRQKKERLLNDVLASAPATQHELARELLAFLRDEASLDVGFCRRQMHRALALEPDGMSARVCALALDAYPHRRFSDRRSAPPRAAHVALVLNDAATPREELVSLRLRQAFGSLTDVEVTRAELLVKQSKHSAGASASRRSRIK